MLTITFMVPDYVLGRQDKSPEENAFSSIIGLLVHEHGGMGTIEILIEVGVTFFVLVLGGITSVARIESDSCIDPCALRSRQGMPRATD